MSTGKSLREKARLISWLVIAVAWMITLGVVFLLSLWLSGLVDALSPLLGLLLLYIPPLSCLLAAALLTVAGWYVHEPHITIEKILVFIDDRNRHIAEEQRQKREAQQRMAEEQERQKREAHQRMVEEQERQKREAQQRIIEEENNRRREFIRQSEESRIQNMGPLELEQYARELFSLMGYQSSLTAKTGDHGVDIRLTSPRGESEIAQCKQWKGRKVTEKDLREFYGCLMDEKAAKGYYIAPHGFTSKAKVWVKDKAIVLVDSSWLSHRASSFLIEPRRTLVFQSDFDSPALAWLESRSPSHRAYCREGFYNIAILAPNWQWYQAVAGPATDFYASVEAQFASNSSSMDAQCGLLFGFSQGPRPSYYRFCFTRWGAYALHVLAGEEPVCLIDFHFTPYFRTDDRVNTLFARVVRHSISIGVNGLVLATINDSSLGSGGVGLFVSTGKTDAFAQARFRDLRLYTEEPDAP